MFDIGGLELLVLAVILIVVVGPKELPGMLRVFGRTMSKVRGMAAEFRGQFDDALREAELDEVRKTVADVGKLNPRTAMQEAMKPFKDAGDGLKRDLEANAVVDLDGPPEFDVSDLDMGPEMEGPASERDPMPDHKSDHERPAGGAPPMEAPVTLDDDASAANDEIADGKVAEAPARASSTQ